jgi:hypothetical protein
LISTTAWIRPLTEAAAGIPTPREVRGSRCRTSEGLFTEWAAGLGFPDYFSHNWDAFHDCLRDVAGSARFDTVGHAASPPPVVVVVRDAADLLADEPPNALSTLLFILGEHVGDDSTAPRLLLLLDDTPGRRSHLAERLTAAGFPPAFPAQA